MLVQHEPPAWATYSAPLGDQYFVRRDGSQDYGDYWGVVTDPDGRVRDRATEREQYLADIVDELAAVEAEVPGRILDIGCGLGWLLSALPETWSKYGTELSPDAADKCRRDGVTILDPELRDAPASPFDCVVMHHVIEHLPDPCWMIRQVRRVMRHGALLILGTPDFFGPCARRFGERYRLLHDKTHISLFSNESMHRFLWDHGFSIDDVRYPFAERYATSETFARWNDGDGVSPPWPGNFMTFYARKVGET